MSLDETLIIYSYFYLTVKQNQVKPLLNNTHHLHVFFFFLTNQDHSSTHFVSIGSQT